MSSHLRREPNPAWASSFWSRMELESSCAFAAREYAFGIVLPTWPDRFCHRRDCRFVYILQSWRTGIPANSNLYIIPQRRTAARLATVCAGSPVFQQMKGMNNHGRNQSTAAGSARVRRIGRQLPAVLCHLRLLHMGFGRVWHQYRVLRVGYRLGICRSHRHLLPRVRWPAESGHHRSLLVLVSKTKSWMASSM